MIITNNFFITKIFLEFSLGLKCKIVSDSEFCGYRMKEAIMLNALEK